MVIWKIERLCITPQTVDFSSSTTQKGAGENYWMRHLRLPAEERWVGRREKKILNLFSQTVLARSYMQFEGATTQWKQEEEGTHLQWVVPAISCSTLLWSPSQQRLWSGKLPRGPWEFQKAWHKPCRRPSQKRQSKWRALCSQKPVGTEDGKCHWKQWRSWRSTESVASPTCCLQWCQWSAWQPYPQWQELKGGKQLNIHQCQCALHRVPEKQWGQRSPGTWAHFQSGKSRTLCA